MSEEKKEPRKKTDEEKKAEQNTLVNLWMNAMGSDTPSEQADEPPQSKG